MTGPYAVSRSMGSTPTGKTGPVVTNGRNTMTPDDRRRGVEAGAAVGSIIRVRREDGKSRALRASGGRAAPANVV